MVSASSAVTHDIEYAAFRSWSCIIQSDGHIVFEAEWPVSWSTSFQMDSCRGDHMSLSAFINYLKSWWTEIPLFLLLGHLLSCLTGIDMLKGVTLHITDPLIRLSCQWSFWWNNTLSVLGDIRSIMQLHEYSYARPCGAKLTLIKAPKLP